MNDTNATIPMPGTSILPASVAARRSTISRFRRLLASSVGPLVETIHDEIGKPKHEALLADVAPLLAACRWHERHMQRVLRAQRIRGAGLFGIGQRHRVERHPLGRVAIIGTWNYPVQLLGIQLVQAYAGGNSIVVKPSERSPRTHGLLLKLAAKAGMDDGVLTWTEATREAGQALLIAQPFDHIVFTGSTEVGREIAEIAAASLTPTTLELSGRDSAIVLDDADCRLAANSLWHSITMNAGQTCMAPRRILVEDAAYARFLDQLTPLVAGVRPLTMIDDESAARTYAIASAAVAAGGRTLGTVLEPPCGRRLRPLAIADCPRGAELIGGNHFGPAVAIVRVRDEVDALRIHHQCGQHLATSLYTRSAARAARLRPLLGATTVCVNDAVLPTAHPGTSIGGRGESGWGISRGRDGLLAMTRPMYVSRTARWPRPPLAPPPTRMLERMARFLCWFYGASRAVGDTGATTAPSLPAQHAATAADGDSSALRQPSRRITAPENPANRS